MNDVIHLDYAALRNAARHNAEARANARKSYLEAAQEAAEKERDYRRARATKLAELRSDGVAWTAAIDLAKGDEDVSTLAFERDLAISKLKASLLRHDELEGERASIRQLGDWSARMEGVPS